jgi:ATP-dependent Clp protease protease subunit
MGGVHGQAADIAIAANEIIKTRDLLANIIARHCNRDVEQVKKDCDRDYYLDSSEALAYGIVDKVVNSRK